MMVQSPRKRGRRCEIKRSVSPEGFFPFFGSQDQIFTLHGAADHFVPKQIPVGSGSLNLASTDKMSLFLPGGPNPCGVRFAHALPFPSAEQRIAPAMGTVDVVEVPEMSYAGAFQL